MKNKIEDLRDHLFEVIEALKDKDAPMELDRAKAVADVAQVVINSAKVEVDYIKTCGKGEGTGFIRIEKKAEPISGAPRLVKGRDS